MSDRPFSIPARLIASFAMIPITFSAYVLSIQSIGAVLKHISLTASDPYSFLAYRWIIGYLSAVIIAYIGFTIIWWPMIRNDPKHRARIVAFHVLQFFIVSAAILLEFFVIDLMGAVTIPIALIGLGVFLLMISQSVSESTGAVKKQSSVLCASCGYDMRGQKECRCPECGAEYTLGEVARQILDQ